MKIGEMKKEEVIYTTNKQRNHIGNQDLATIKEKLIISKKKVLIET